MEEKIRPTRCFFATIENSLIETFSSLLGLLTVLLFVLTVQLAVSVGSYSGRGAHPMHGDFEAQRHWMEITIHIPIREWYINGTNNDLNYWGLDYPPLTAYHSYLLGKISKKINKSWVELFVSRGIETKAHKLFMRISVLVTMWSLYFLSLIIYVRYWSVAEWKVPYYAICLLYPGLIAIDNGHFQYNHISLGLFVVAFLGFSSVWPVFGSIFFVLAVNFKQMELYHSLPIAIFLLSSSFYTPLNSANFSKSLAQLLKHFFAVCTAFAVVWAPLYGNGADVLQVLRRIFPFYRGLFEDKVANVWCALNVFIKLKERFDTQYLIKLSTVTVLISLIPSLLCLLTRPTVKNLKTALLISSLSFFLFSYQVHEKSILLTAVPALLLWPENPVATSWLLIISNASLFPLCVQDGNALHLSLFFFYYILLLPIFSLLSYFKRLFVQCSCLTSMALCFLSLIISPPQRYPHIFPLANALFSFAHFIMFFIYFNFLMLKERQYEKCKLS